MNMSSSEQGGRRNRLATYPSEWPLTFGEDAQAGKGYGRFAYELEPGPIEPNEFL